MANTKTKKKAADPKKVTVPDGYKPGKDEEFMNPVMLEYFRHKLLDWKGELVRESSETLMSLQDGGLQEPDIADRASAETDRALELRTRDRARKLISKIDEAIRRIDDDDFGYCEVTGEPISIKRLEARPIATMTLEAQEQHERRERTQRDD
ncbi:MAG: RNA polymerase-binding protein DksA [Pseudomonadota bacterium]